ncbi:MAG: hypothetical protein J6Y25_02355 [Elusimicrobiaceae bacterium]|nr:hypothetical protein [Elusimicrobiaceae bacterium]
MRGKNLFLIGLLSSTLVVTFSAASWGQMEESGSSTEASASRAGGDGSWDGSYVREQLVKPSVNFPAQIKDPTLSPDDVLLLKHREQQRLAAEAAERKRQEEAERKRRAEEEKKRQWELMLLKDPTILIRDKIHIGGIIDKEVLIGGKLYTIGNTYMGAKIVAVSPDSVTFSYKGHKFVRRVKL